MSLLFKSFPNSAIFKHFPSSTAFDIKKLPLIFRTGLISSIKMLKNESNILTKRFKINDGYACHGDSGGPLVVENEGSSVIVGVVSMVPSVNRFLSWPPPCYCSCENVPEIHARVRIAVPWIEEIMDKKKLAFSCARKGNL